MKRLLGFLGLVALFAWPMACSREAAPAGSPGDNGQVAQRQSRCSFGRVPEADARTITEAVQRRFPPSPDNTYEVIGVYYAEPERAPTYSFLAVLRVVGIAGPRVLLFDQATGQFDRSTGAVTDLARTTFDPTRCPEVATTSPTP